MSTHAQLKPTHLKIAAGARAVEAELCQEVQQWRSAGLAGIQRPLRIIVPSRSLRLHVGRRLTQQYGAMLGVRIDTLSGLANEVLERAGELAPRGAWLVDVLVRRYAAEEPPLIEALGKLDDGFGAALGAVRDLLDAGVTPFIVEALVERLQDDPDEDRRARAAALVRVAGRVAETLEAAPFGRPGNLLSRARGVLLDDPSLLPASRLVVHGFASATGAATELLGTLGALFPTCYLLDHPPLPESRAPGEGGPGERGPGDGHPADGHPGEPGDAEHPRHLEERLAAPIQRRPVEPGPGTTLSVMVAPSVAAELRHVGREIRRRLDRAGAHATQPEDLAIIARDLGAYVLPIRRELRALGIPFSGDSTPGPLTPAGRRARALLSVLRRRGRCPVDAWLDSLGALSVPGETGVSRVSPSADLRLGLRISGTVYLEDVAVMEEAEAHLVLPSRRAAAPPEDDEEPGRAPTGVDDSEPDAPSQRGARTLDKAVLNAAIGAAKQLQGWFERRAGPAAVGSWLGDLSRMLREELGWDDDTLGGPGVEAALAAIAEELPADFVLSPDELERLLHEGLAEVDPRPLGGAGGGVQVLSMTEARGRTFSHIFLIGLDRGSFPKVPREDPLLPDAVRRLLVSLLPDLGLAARALGEERYQFAQLLSAAPEVSLSWTEVDDRGRVRPASPMLERLLLARGIQPIRALPAIPTRWEEVSPTEATRGARKGSSGSAGTTSTTMFAAMFDRPPEELPMLAGLFGPRRTLGSALAVAWRALPDPGPLEILPERLAAARVRILEEADPDRRTAEGRARLLQAGPYQGYLGAAAGREPLSRNRWLTELESMAACAWQLFLERLLELRPIPEPGVELPSVDAALAGRIVHAVLERMVREAFASAGVKVPRQLAQARHTPLVSVPWPEPARLERMIEEEAAQILRREGIGLPGFWRAFAPMARERLAVAKGIDWAGGPLSVLGVEVEGQILRTIGDREVRIAFRADRVDEGLRLSEYKSGRPREGKNPEKHREKLLAHMRAGQRLQAGGYALASTGGGRGRYVHLHPEEPMVIELQTDEELDAVFQQVAETVIGAWDAGTFLPRLVDGTLRAEPPRCKYCRVATGCTRGDSGFRGRLVGQIEAAGAHPPEGPAGAGLALLRLGQEQG